MIRLSSNITLMLRIAVPVAWLSFFGIFMIAIFLVDPVDKPILGNTIFRAVYVFLFVLFFVLIYFSLWQLKRIEVDQNFLYVTDYFKTARYPLEDVQAIQVTNLLICKLGRIELNDAGVFGRKMPFIIKKTNLKEFKKIRPSLFE